MGAFTAPHNMDVKDGVAESLEAVPRLGQLRRCFTNATTAARKRISMMVSWACGAHCYEDFMLEEEEDFYSILTFYWARSPRRAKGHKDHFYPVQAFFACQWPKRLLPAWPRKKPSHRITRKREITFRYSQKNNVLDGVRITTLPDAALAELLKSLPADVGRTWVKAQLGIRKMPRPSAWEEQRR